MDYMWYSSIPKRWIEILGKDSFKPMKNRSNPFRNTIEFIRETQTYIDRISIKPLGPTSSSQNSLKLVNSLPYSPRNLKSVKPLNSLKPISKIKSLKATTRRHLPSKQNLPELKMSIKSMSSRCPSKYDDSFILDKPLKMLYRENNSYPHLNRLLNQNFNSCSKLPMQSDRFYLSDVNYRSRRLYKQHLMVSSLSTPKLPSSSITVSCSSRIE